MPHKKHCEQLKSILSFYWNRIVIRIHEAEHAYRIANSMEIVGCLKTSYFCVPTEMPEAAYFFQFTNKKIAFFIDIERRSDTICLYR